MPSRPHPSEVTTAVEFRLAIDAIPGLGWSTHPDGAVEFVNQRWCDYTGLSPEESRGQRWKVAIHAAERKAALARGLPFEIEQRARRNDGQYRWFLIRYNPFRNDQEQVTRWYATGTDIDDRVRAEERTRNENLALREQIDRDSMFENIVGSSEALRKVLRQIAKLASSDSTVLILGETVQERS